ncbi:MAG TPA: pilus assembly protein, partial [Nitrosomonas halophila]|nr:pilus assembly protein [Nitrosomonas halophila]
HCEVKRPEIANWFIQVLNLLPGVEIGEQTVGASAVATLVPGQTTCAIPVAICEAGLEDKSKGDWLFTLLEPGDGLDGSFLWASVNSSNKEIKDILTGSSCDIPASNTPIGSPGVKGGAYNAWNTRFGLYQGSNSPTNAVPDFTGFTYTAKSWNQCKNAFDDFAGKRANYAPYQDAKNKSDHTGLKFPVDPSSVLTHREGGDRRLVTVPVVDCSVLNGPTKQTNAKSWACVLMLHPLDNNPENAAFCPGQQNRAALEYLGPADDPKSPCASEGVPGGQNSVGPLVPALVR